MALCVAEASSRVIRDRLGANWKQQCILPQRVVIGSYGQPGPTENELAVSTKMGIIIPTHRKGT